ncbi:MAG: c-type cytochrome, partial [Planctomycetales bacterium]|nr:c-type cytochrome [Planctomycetales bacterium]
NPSPIPDELFSTGGGRSLYDEVAAAVAGIGADDAQKFADLAAMVRGGRGRDTAVSVLRGIDRKHWSQKEVLPLVDSLVAYLTQIPAKYRTGSSAVEATELTRSLSAALPAAQAKAVADRLQNLDVRVVAISTVPHRMIYDKEKIVVAAGKAVELRLSNADQMPHNLAITLPGAMEEVGLLAEATAQTPDVMARQYVPKSDKILWSSQLLQPGDSQALSFEAPRTPGVYPMVCTYPGHWRRMHAAMIVVENVDDYLADPEKYLATNKIVVQDELLKLIGQRHEWKLDDLLEFVQPLEKGRSYQVGFNAFKVSSCVACHKIGDEGQAIGPDLTKLDPMKRNGEHILRSLLNPSEKIEEKYQSYSFVLTSGKVVTGMILAETDADVSVIENPLAKAKPVVIAKADIEERTKAAKSIMPEGLLDKLTREEVLDLIAFVHAGGNEKADTYAGGEHHHHDH